ncbi:hypothetical protein O163_12915 [Caldanaerobacter subterraneus subsp. yonseiensis KB-1]|uniref:Uncharacterized protein n=1 Tax=Caldanaerobacter subterraneus subsp. yonseiensis KB-1 TaxID=1388761 RepID=U5CS88_CALSX|nr:hypothetical protein O163_12915 [Caldanaerobacter subterraneus subsp. yonseiensis KB-1]
MSHPFFLIFRANNFILPQFLLFLNIPYGQLEENVVIYKRKKPLSSPVRLARSYKKKYRKPSCQCKKVFLEVVG